MLQLYRWNPEQKIGTWTKFEPTLPMPTNEVWWLNLENPTPEEEQAVFTEWAKIHLLTTEDITRSRRLEDGLPHFPKVEEFPDYLFVIANPLRPDTAPTPVNPRCTNVQLSAILTRHLLITHHYEALPAITYLSQFLQRHCEQAGRGPDYLFHLILDALVDEYAPEIDRLAEQLDEIETSMFVTPSQELLGELIHLKRRVVMFRKTLILEREVLARLTRGEFELVDEREIVYYRNVYDHLVRYTELIEGAREMISDLMQTHLAAVSNRLNSIMKVLTMVSTSILPMTLVAGIYGMNFEHMPELKWALGYPFALFLMLLAAGIPLALFYWRKWL